MLRNRTTFFDLGFRVQYGYFRLDDGLMVTIPGNSTVTARLPGGLLTLRQTTGYPHEDRIQFEVLTSESRKRRTLAVFAPSWIQRESVFVTVNGRKTEYAIENDFLVIKRPMKRGDVIEIQFKQVVGSASLLCPERTPGFHRYMHGPLVLGVDTREERTMPPGVELAPLGAACYRANGLRLAPLCDLTDRKDAVKGAKGGSIQVLFRD